MEVSTTNCYAYIASISEDNAARKRRLIVIDHHIFHSTEGWRKTESLQHPTLLLRLTTEKSDYDHVGASFPKIAPSHVTIVTDTGAQSCLWGLQDFYRCGFRKSDLLPVRRVMIAANREEIQIEGVLLVRLSGEDARGRSYTAPIMAYVSPSTHRFYLSHQSLVQLGVIPKNFPQVGAAMETSAIDHQIGQCDCAVRSLPPGRPDALPFPFIPANNTKMRAWLVDRYSASTFNKCPHQQLKGMTGPDIRLHIDYNAKPVAVHTPATVPLHWQGDVEQQIKDDIALGVLEKVPIGEPSVWCHRMVLARKPNGKPRRTVDLSPINRHCMRETHRVKPPFQQAKAVPPDTWKSVTDAWNGYHSVPLHPADRHLTTFITPWGRFRYKVAPQGFLASGDGHTRRFDEVITDVPRKTKCVDDTLLWDTELEMHWWRMIDFLELLGRNGIVLNSDDEKFQFAQRDVKYAGFHITEKEIRPVEKVLRAIREFPTTTRITDIRSWFELVHQVAHYNKLIDIMAPLKPLLSPSAKFVWTDGLEDAFQQSKIKILNAIIEGVQIFDTKRRTCLRPDWSKTGLDISYHRSTANVQPRLQDVVQQDGGLR